MDLSKEFETINHDLLVANFHACGFSNDSLKLLYSYLNNRWYRTKINLKFSSWEELGLRSSTRVCPWTSSIYYLFKRFVLSI